MEFQIYGNLGDYLSFSPIPLPFLLISKRMAEVPKRKIKQTSNGYWEEIPSDIMGVIVERLSLSDRIRASIVSKHWGAIALQKHIPTTPQIPWLTLPHGYYSKELSFLDMSAGKIQKLKLPKRLQGMVCCGSSKGWLFMAKDCPLSLLQHKFANYCRQVMEAQITIKKTATGHVLCFQSPTPESDIFMFNPICGEVHQLPSLFTIPCYEQFLQERGIEHNVSCFINSIQISSAEISECIVAAAFEVGDSDSIMLAVCRPGNKQWSEFTAKTQDKNLEFTEFLFNKRTLYVISSIEHMESYRLELGGGYGVNIKLIPGLHIEAEDVAVDIRLRTNDFMLVSNPFSYLYLVESTRGELLLIKRRYDQLESPSLLYMKTSGFHVFKMDHNTGQWRRLYNIDDQVLFISCGGSSSLSANDFVGVEGNCIYFTQDIDYCEYQCLDIESRECGVFYLRDGQIKRSFPSFNLPLPSSIGWFTPSL